MIVMGGCRERGGGLHDWWCALSLIWAALLAGALAAPGLGFGGPALAADQPARAFFNGEAEPSIQALVATEFMGREPLLMLVQASPATTAEAHNGSIIVAFPMSAPDSIEEDIAKDHELELIERVKLPALGRRFGVYRVKDGQSVDVVLTQLQADPRTVELQANLQHRPPEDSEPATEVSQLGKSGVPRPEAADRKTAAAAKPARKTLASPAKAETAGGSGRTRLAQESRPPAPVNRTAMRWPTADEPFVEPGPAGR